MAGDVKTGKALWEGLLGFKEGMLGGKSKGDSFSEGCLPVKPGRIIVQ